MYTCRQSRETLCITNNTEPNGTMVVTLLLPILSSLLLAACPTKALQYRLFGLSSQAARRAFIVLIVSLHAVFLGVARL